MMGRGLTYWLMMFSMATVSLWFVMAQRNWKYERKGRAIGCLVLGFYFLDVCMIRYNNHVLHHAKDLPGGIELSFVAASLGFLGSSILLVYANRYGDNKL